MKNISPLLLFLLVFIALRMLVLLTESPQYGFGLAEFFRATAAHDLMSNRKFSLFDYTYRHNEGGSLVVALILVPIFKIFGTSAFSLHLVGLFFSICSFIIGFYLIKKYLGTKEANIFGIIFTLAPQAYLVLSYTAWGSHMESILFTFLIIYCLGKIFLTENIYPIKEYSYSSLLGLICGFSIWFGYINIIGLITCIMCILIFEKYFFLRKSFLFFLILFSIGLSPLIIYNINYAHGKIGMILYKPLYAHFFNINFKDFFSKTFSLFIYDFPLSLFFKDGLIVPRKYLAYFSYIFYIIIFSFFIVIRIKSGFSNLFMCNKSRKLINVFILVYLTIFFGIYLLSDFRVEPSNICKGYRYILAVSPLFFILLSQAYGFLSNKNYIWKGFIYVLILLNLIGISGLLNFKNFLKSTTVSPISYWSFGISIANKFGDNLEKCISYSQKLDSKSRNYFFYGLGEEMAQRCLTNPETLNNDFEKIPEQYRMTFYMSFGESVSNKLSYDIRKIMTFLNKLDKKYIRYAYIGLGGSMASNGLTNFKDFSKQINDKYICSFYEGVGGAILYSLQSDLKKCSSILTNSNEIDNIYRGCCFSGLSLIILLDERMPDWKCYLEALRASSEDIPDRYRTDFLKGINEKCGLLKKIFQ